LSAHYKEQFLQWGIKAYKKVRRDVAKEIKTVTLDMTPWKAVVLPNDCTDWIAIGIKDGEMLKTFVNDPSLNPRDCAVDESEPTAPTFNNVDVTGEGVQWFNCSALGEDPGKLYGMLIKNNGLGYFNPNYHQGVNEIQLSAQVPAGTRIYLMYLGTLFDPATDPIVHPYFQEYIGYSIHYDNLKHRRRAGDRRISSDMVEEAKRERDEEYCNVVEMKCDWSIEAILETMRAAIRLSPKR
jgi:hypothetical protein